MNDLPIVSFFASPPTLPGSPPFPTNGYGAADGSIDPTFLPEVWESLKAKKAVPTGLVTSVAGISKHMMVRVASVAEIGQWLAQYSLLTAPPQLRVQLIGHSTSGQLSLGGGWDLNAQRWQPPFLWFDSNPHALEPLAYADLVAEVMLAGCYIAQRLSNVNAINGRTLLFALSEMWRCRARGAVTSVNPADFDSDGWYVGVDEAPPIGWAWSTHETTFEGAADTRWAPTATKLEVPTRITCNGETIDDAARLASFCAYFNALLPEDQAPRGALPEATLTLWYGDQSQPAYLLANATILAVGERGSRKFYANASRAMSTDDVAALVNRFASLTGVEPSDARSP